jgi:hypothetical protein
METLSLVVSVGTLCAFIVGGLLLKGFLPSYVTEKGKNKASKEDLKELTGIVEDVRTANAEALERLKSDLVAEGHVTERRRAAYEEICAGLRVFVAGHDQDTEAKERFHAAYAGAWLWLPDDALVALNHFLELQQRVAEVPDSVPQDEVKASYSEVVLAMRRHAGFKATAVRSADYQFVSFTS